MHDMTEANLHNAFSGESMAHMRYTAYADKADKEGFENVARLFRAIAYAEQVHATNHLERSPKVDTTALGGAPFGVGTTSENLQFGIDGENFEISEMYPAYLAVAELQDEGRAEQSFHWALEAEKVHASMFQEAKQTVDAGDDIDLGPVQICEVCGYTVEGEAPDRCPICQAKKEMFREFA